jgi:hypothetical protein
MEANRKRTKVHRLPTEDKADIIMFNSELYLNNGYIEDDDQYLLGDTTSNSHQEPKSAFEFQHLYFTTDEEIIIGISSIFVKIGGLVVRQCSNSLPFIGKKIIASTDPKLCIECTYKGDDKCKSLPQPSEAFIKAYCEQGGIDEVDVEYEYHKVWDKRTEELLEKYFTLKLDLRGLITIHHIV